MMSSLLANVDEYKCTLDEKTLNKAISELKEDPNDRETHVQKLREWVLSQATLKCPTDTRFLLSFLRVRYFSQLDSRKLLENYLMRMSRFPSWFKNLDTHDPKFLSTLDDGFVLLLPSRDEEGRRIIIFRPGLIDLSNENYTKQDVLRSIACIIDYLYLCDEMTAVNGTVAIADLGGMTLKHVTYFSNDERKDFLQSWQACYPARVKQIHIYNTGPVAEMLLQIIRMCMSEKIQNRLKIHGQTLSSLYKEVPMTLLPSDYLPDEYSGGNAGSVAQIIGGMKVELMRKSVRERLLFLTSDKFGAGSQLPKSVSSSNFADITEGCYRKLALD